MIIMDAESSIEEDLPSGVIKHGREIAIKMKVQTWENQTQGSLLSVIQPPEKYPEMAKSHESWTAYDHQVAIEQVK